MNQVDSFFKKIPGYYFGILTLCVGIMGSGVAIGLYLLEDSSFSIFNNFISDLSIGPNNADLAFLAFMILMPISIVPFFLFLTRFLQSLGANRTISWLAFGISVIYSISQIITGFFPLDPTNQTSYDTHLIVAEFLFVSVGIGMLLYSYLEFSIENIPKYLPITAGLSGILALAFSTFLYLGSYTTLFDYNVVTYLSEWSAFGVFFIWLFLQSYYLNKSL